MRKSLETPFQSVTWLQRNIFCANHSNTFTAKSRKNLITNCTSHIRRVRQGEERKGKTICRFFLSPLITWNYRLPDDDCSENLCMLFILIWRNENRKLISASCAAPYFTSFLLFSRFIDFHWRNNFTFRNEEIFS